MTVQIPVPTLLNFNSLATLSPPAAVALTDKVVKALTNHVFFKDIPLDQLSAAGTALAKTIKLTDAGDHSSIPDRNTQLAWVIKELTRVAFDVQVQAMDEESQLFTSGLPIFGRRTRPYKAVKAAVTVLTGLEAINLDDPGEAMLNADSQDGAFGYQFQFTKQDPAVEENWVDEGVPHRGCKKVVIRGLDPLSKYTFRGRAIGDDGAGPWSKPVTISVT